MDPRTKLAQMSQTDQAFRLVRAEVQKHIQLAADLVLEKALAHHDKPDKHPLPADPKAPERAMAQLIDKCGPLRRRRMRDALEQRVGKKDKDRNAYFGALAGVDPGKATPVLEQMRPLLRSSVAKPAPAQMQALARTLQAAFPRPHATGGAASRLVLELTRIKCVEKTHEAFEGKDEIELIVAPRREQDFLAGAQASLPKVKIKLGKFEQGQERTTPQELASFALDAATTFPQGFAARLTLSEADVLDPDQRGDLAFNLLFSFDYLVSVAGLIVFLLVPALAGAATIVFLIAGFIVITFPLWQRRLFDDDFETANEFIFLNSAADPLPATDHVNVDLLPNDLELLEGEFLRRGRYSMDLQWKLA
jgi:hypothetical protein